MEVNRRTALMVGVVGAVGLTTSGALARSRPQWAGALIVEPMGLPESDSKLTWLTNGREVVLWAARVQGVPSVPAGQTFTVPAEDGVVLRLRTGDRVQQIDLAMMRDYRWSLGPHASLALTLKPLGRPVT